MPGQAAIRILVPPGGDTAIRVLDQALAERFSSGDPSAYVSRNGNLSFYRPDGTDYQVVVSDYEKREIVLEFLRSRRFAILKVTNR